MDEDIAGTKRVAMLTSYASAGGLALRTALASYSPVASFSDDFCPNPDVFLLGGLGLPCDSANVPPEVEPDSPRQRRDKLHASAARWVREASIDMTELRKFPNPVARSMFAHAYGKGITVYEPIGGMCAGLEACLRNGFKVSRYLCSEPDANAASVVSSRLECLSSEYPHLLEPDAYKRVWLDLPLDPAAVDERALLASGACDDSQWFVFASWCWHDVGKKEGALLPNAGVTDHVFQILQTLQRIQRRGPAYMFVCEQPRQSWKQAVAAQQRLTQCLGAPVLVDAVQFDSFAHRLSAHWTNLTGHSNLAAVSAVVRPSGTYSQGGGGPRARGVLPVQQGR